MIKADEKVKSEETDGKEVEEKYTHFEELQKRVEVLQEQVELIAEILAQKGLFLKESTSPIIEISNEVYKRLEEGDE